MNKLDKKLVLIGIRKKGERRFKIRTVAEMKSDNQKLIYPSNSAGIALTR